MGTRSLVMFTIAAASLLAASCAQQSRSKAPPPDQLAVGDIPGAVPVITPTTTTRQSQSNPRPIGGNTIAPIPAPGEDSVAAARRMMMNIPKFGDYVYVTDLPEAVERVKPEYPAAARSTGVSGTVMVQALVLADGTVGDTRIIKSIPPLDEAATSAVRKWKFKPALNKDVPTAVWVGVPVTFTLE